MEMLLRAVAKPFLCGWCATRRGGVGCMNGLLLLLGVADRKIVDGWRCDWNKHGKIRLHVNGPSSCLVIHLNLSISLIFNSSLALLIRLVYYRTCKRAEFLSPAHQSCDSRRISYCASLQSSQNQVNLHQASIQH